MEKTICPNCKNDWGFVFGRCIQCGFNHDTNKFEVIKVDVEDLPEHIRYYLVMKHIWRTHKENGSNVTIGSKKT